MRAGAIALALPLVFALAVAGDCRGQRRRPDSPARPRCFDFHTLYNTNCQACHGADGTMGRRWSWVILNTRRWWTMRTLRKWISGGMRERRCRRLRSRPEGC